MSTIAGSTLPAIAAASAGPAPERLPADPPPEGSSGWTAPPPKDGAKGAATPPAAGVAAVVAVDGGMSCWVTAAPPTAPATTRATATAAAPRPTGRLRAPSEDVVAPVASGLSAG